MGCWFYQHRTAHTITSNHKRDSIVKPRDGLCHIHDTQEWMFLEYFSEKTVCEDWVPASSIFMDQGLLRVLLFSRKAERVQGPGVETRESPHFGPWCIAGTKAGICFHLPLLRFQREERRTRTCQRRSVKKPGVMSERVSLGSTETSPFPGFPPRKGMQLLESATLWLLTHLGSVKCWGLLISG